MEKELNEMQASKLPHTKFKTMVIRMVKEHLENFNSIKKRHDNHLKGSEIKNALTKMKNKSPYRESTEA